MINKYYIFSLFLVIGFGFGGCSGKKQIAPSGSEYSVSTQEFEFRSKQEKNKIVESAYKQGYDSGYADAKAEFEKIIPYIEAIRASAELKNSGGLCLPPLFLDKSTPGKVALTLGEVHICSNFTVENVLSAVKSGIPGLPEYNKVATPVVDSNVNIDNSVSGIVLAGTDPKSFFVEEVGQVVQSVKVTIDDTFTNREILRTSKFNFSKSEIGNNNTLLVEFANGGDAKDFCTKYAICK